MSVGCERSGDVCGCDEGLVHALVGVARPSFRERPKRRSECVANFVGV